MEVCLVWHYPNVSLMMIIIRILPMKPMRDERVRREVSPRRMIVVVRSHQPVQVVYM